MADREKVISGLEHCRRGPIGCQQECPYKSDFGCRSQLAADALELLKEQEPDQSKYEYHIDHTDCLWYNPDEENICPVTCSEYRDGWNDAMNYIFKNGNGYHPHKRR